MAAVQMLPRPRSFSSRVKGLWSVVMASSAPAEEPLPERLLVGLRAQGRLDHRKRAQAVHVGGGEEQVVRAGLAGHGQPRRLRRHQRVERGGTGDVGDVHVRVDVAAHDGQLRDAHGFDHGRAAGDKGGGVGAAGGLHPPLEELDQPLVFGMKRDQPAGLLDQLEGTVDLVLLVDADAQKLVLAPLGRSVRKDLEAAGALFRHAEHFVPVEQAGRPVEAKVDIRFGFPEAAAVDQDLAAGAAGDADGHLEDRRDAAGRRGLGLGHKGATLRVAGGAHVKVDVDGARQEIAAVGGDLAGAPAAGRRAGRWRQCGRPQPPGRRRTRLRR